MWAGLLVSNVGTWMQNVAQSWLIYKMTGNDPLYLGLLGLAFAVPMVLVPPLGGAVADRVDRVRLLYVTQTSSLLLAVALAALASSGHLRPWHLLATTFAGAVLLAFDNPARQSLIPDLVPRELLPNALSLNAATYTGAALVGPALAGVLLAPLGAAWIFLLNAASFLAVIFALAGMKRQPARERRADAWDEALLGGLRYAARSPRTRLLLILSALAAICGRSYQQLLPIFADEWRAGAEGYGLLLAAGGAGALLGALGLSSLRELPKREPLLVASGVAFTAVLAGFALNRWFPGGLALLLAAGILSTVFTTMIATIIQLEVPGALRGRVLGLYAITLIGLPSLGSLGAATVARWLGAPRAVLLGALATLAAVLAAAPVLLARRDQSSR